MKINHPLLWILLFTCQSAFSQLKEIQYFSHDTNFKSYYIFPKADTQAGSDGILIIPAWYGPSELDFYTATRLANLGYYTFILDVYGEKYQPNNNQEASQISSFFKKNSNLYLQRIKLGLDQFKSLGIHFNKIVIIGYCFGGTGAIEAGLANLNVQGIVSFHGGLSSIKPREINKIYPKILIMQGAEDPSISAEDVLNIKTLLKSGQADWQIIEFGKAAHSFTNPKANANGNKYNKEADQRSWNYLQLFLREIFEK